MRNFLILFVLLLVGPYGLSQNKITGTVSANMEKLPGAMVALKSGESDAILSYGSTDADGNFSLVPPNNALELVISVSYLGFKTFEKRIENTTLHLDITLEESPEELREVVVTAHDIEKRGDTLSYSVSAFKGQKDRSIADVIKKLPGVAVMPNGQISYMGQPIEKYYIEGMDMLEGRYNLANDNISADDVVKVQILENHQPIKVLDSLVYSERTSLNIKLKSNVSLTGSAEVGAGFSPFLFKTNVTPLLFTKKSQTLASYQYNNMGEDLTRSNNDFSIPGNLISGGAARKSILSVQQLPRLPFSSGRWLYNDDHLGNMNHLQRFKNGTELKINLSYLNGTHTDYGSRNTTYITPGDTIRYAEKINNKIFLNSLGSKLTLERNLAGSYFINTFAARTFWDSQRGEITNDNGGISQQLSNPYLSLTNHLKVIRPIGKQLLTLDSNIGYSNTDQQLTVWPGQFQGVLNNGEPYEGNRQHAGLSTFFSENIIGLAKKWGAFTIAPKAGIAYKNEKLASRLLKFSGGNQEQLDGNYKNDLQLSNSNLFVANDLNFKKNNWTILLKTPLYLRHFKTENELLGSRHAIGRINLEPDLLIVKKISPYWEASIRGNIVNRFGEIDNLFEGYILKNYLSLVQYNTVLSEQKNHASSLNIRYRNALKGFFATVGFSIAKNKNNLLYSNSVAGNGSIIIESIERDNEVSTKSVNATASKYFSRIKTTVTWGSRFSFSERPQIVNATLMTYKSKDQLYEVDVKSEIAKWLSFAGSTKLAVAELQAGDKQLGQIKNLEASMAVFFYMDAHQFLNIDAEHYYNSIGSNKNNNYFLNISYQFTIKKYKLDTRISWNNILDTNNYASAFNGNFFTNENFYRVRPSQFLVSFKFTL